MAIYWNADGKRRRIIFDHRQLNLRAKKGDLVISLADLPALFAGGAFIECTTTEDHLQLQKLLNADAAVSVRLISEEESQAKRGVIEADQGRVRLQIDCFISEQTMDKVRRYKGRESWSLFFERIGDDFLD